MSEAPKPGPIKVVIAWPATIYLTVEVGHPDSPDDEWGLQIVGSEVYAEDNPKAGRVHDVRGPMPGAVLNGPEFAEHALGYVAAAEWPTPELKA